MKKKRKYQFGGANQQNIENNQNPQNVENNEDSFSDPNEMNRVFEMYLQTLPKDQQRVLIEQIRYMNNEQKQDLAERMKVKLIEKGLIQSKELEESQGQGEEMMSDENLPMAPEAAFGMYIKPEVRSLINYYKNKQ